MNYQIGTFNVSFVQFFIINISLIIAIYIYMKGSGE